jgi:diguanylate cyclase (GGDEF)-like protein/PAS domain S-box-containing protein
LSEIVLIITDVPEDAKTLEEALVAAEDGPFHVEWVQRLSDGLERIRRRDVDIILVDFFLPDSQGIETFNRIFSVIPSPPPILSLSAPEHYSLAREAVQRGAQGYLSKGHFRDVLVSQALRNVIERKKVEDALFIEKERAQVTLDSIGDAVISVDISGYVTYLNRMAEKMTGWSDADARGLPLLQVFNLIEAATGKPAMDYSAIAIDQNKTLWLSPLGTLIRRDGCEVAIEDSVAPIHDRNGNTTGAVIVFHDVSEAKAMTEKMAHLAQHDFLTGLPNRLLLNDRIDQAIELATRNRKKLAVLFLDLDHFKQINDSLGHLIGDRLLQSVAARLKSCVRKADTVSRQGGDEFVILLSEDDHGEDAWLSAEKILAALTAEFSIDEHNLHITVSVGISVFPDDGQDAQALLKNADTAMYQAKEKGRNHYQFFRQNMNDVAVERLSIQSDLRRALEHHEFALLFQPKVNLESGHIVGVEALIRWNHPHRGLMPPAKFICIAEECGLIVPIGRWAMEVACQQAKAWANAGTPITVAVNVSAMEFRDTAFLTCVRSILKETGLDPSCLELELTESILMKNAESSVQLLNALKDVGVKLAVDDFGTGYSSLSYLSQFPIDTLKIDQSFVQNLCTTSDNGIIVSAVISMGKSLRQKVIAEGIETSEQLEYLRSHHCIEGQGYYFSRPVTADAIGKLIGKSNSIQ